MPDSSEPTTTPTPGTPMVPLAEAEFVLRHPIVNYESTWPLLRKAAVPWPAEPDADHWADIATILDAIDGWLEDGIPVLEVARLRRRVTNHHQGDQT